MVLNKTNSRTRLYVRPSDLNEIARIFRAYRSITCNMYITSENLNKKSESSSIQLRFRSMHQRLNFYIFSVSSKRYIL